MDINRMDVHVHLEKGAYQKEWLQKFIDTAIQRNIKEIDFVEHTHIFNECASLYYEMSEYNEYQKNWFARKQKAARPIADYLHFIQEMKQQEFPIKLKFGLEVCYSPEHEAKIAQLKEMPFDFLVGSIHFIDGWAFSHLKQRWNPEDYDLGKLYHRYYELMDQLILSRLFNGLAHPQSLQCFGAYPPTDYHKTYDSLATHLKQNSMYIENSTGLAANYGDPCIGMNPAMYQSMIKYGVPVLPASDAHVPENVGLLFDQLNEVSYEI